MSDTENVSIVFILKKKKKDIDCTDICNMLGVSLVKF